ncbi:hypothetical protein Leryth_003573 [Lithospermum erythrorhizon]|nr:hypothetical protein Leryth_003573 [Lithospermum erythrorhizon]
MGCLSSSPTKPISRTSLIPSKHRNSSNSYVSSNNVFVSTTLSNCIHISYVQTHKTRSNVVTNSKQTVSSSEAGKEEIFDVPVFSCSEVYSIWGPVTIK